MTLSANTLFHFTKDAESLISILKNGFYPRFCLEDFTETGNIVAETTNLQEMAIPMVCFCDIPLSKITDQIDFYGSYGIGLTKNWGIQSGLNPLLYITKKSLLNSHLVQMRAVFLNPIDGDNKHFIHWIETVSYIKPVQGKMYKGGAFVEKVFYDENEWRYVPVLHENGSAKGTKEYRLSKEHYLDNIIRTNANNELKDAVKLPFVLTDVKYLIVPTQAEARLLANSMHDVMKTEAGSDINLLISRIITCEQVREDF